MNSFTQRTGASKWRVPSFLGISALFHILSVAAIAAYLKSQNPAHIAPVTEPRTISLHTFLKPSPKAETPTAPTEPRVSTREDSAAPQIKQPLPSVTEQNPRVAKKQRTASSPAANPKRQVPQDIPAALRSSYESYLLGLFEQHKRYPSSAKRRRLSGTVTVSFEIARSGALKSVTLKESSGAPILDRNVTDMIQRLAPYRPFPKGTQLSQVRFVIPIEFRIK